MYKRQLEMFENITYNEHSETIFVQYLWYIEKFHSDVVNNNINYTFIYIQYFYDYWVNHEHKKDTKYQRNLNFYKKLHFYIHSVVEKLSSTHRSTHSQWLK